MTPDPEPEPEPSYKEITSSTPVVMSDPVFINTNQYFTKMTVDGTDIYTANTGFVFNPTVNSGSSGSYKVNMRAFNGTTQLGIWRDTGWIYDGNVVSTDFDHFGDPVFPSDNPDLSGVVDGTLIFTNLTLVTT